MFLFGCLVGLVVGVALTEVLVKNEYEKEAFRLRIKVRDLEAENYDLMKENGFLRNEKADNL